MNVFLYPLILVAALTARAGSFSFYAGKQKYLVTVVVTEHTVPLGKLSLSAALALASKIVSGDTSVVIRIGADDYTFSVVPVTA